VEFLPKLMMMIVIITKIIMLIIIVMDVSVKGRMYWGISMMRKAECGG
jgi:hypothetical protein